MFGQLPDCPERPCDDRPPCYEECDHSQRIFDEVKLLGNQPYLLELLKGVLKTQEQFIECLCRMCKVNSDTGLYECDICYLGDLIGFPPVQCGFVGVDRDINCDPDFSDLFCNPEKTKILRCCGLDQMCVCHINLDIRTTTIDFCETEQGLELYTRIVNALINFNGSASLGGIEEIASEILPNSKVVKIENGIIYLYVENLTNYEWASLPIIINALPVPIGMEIELVTKCE